MLTKFYKGMQLGHVTQGFKKSHPALDIVFGYGTPLCAPEDCVVTRISGDGPVDGSTDGIKYGYGIHLRGKETGQDYLFWHCLPYFPVWGGDSVKRGQIVAFMGNAGYVTVGGRALTVEERDHLENGKFKLETGGTHLHIEGELNGVGVDLLPQINWNWEPQYTKFDLIKAITACLSKMARAIK